MNGFVWGPVVAGAITPALVGSAALMSLLIVGAVLLGMSLIAFVVWYGLVRLRIFFKI